MATITKPNTFSAGATIVAAEHNDNFDTIYNDYNGNITNANISASAAIADTKLAQITTANKVALSALAATGNYGPSGNWTPTGIWDFTGATFAGASPLVFEGATANDFETTLTVTDPTADRTVTIPDADVDLTNFADWRIKGWANIDGTGTAALDDSFNVSGIVDNGTGDYTVTWDTDFATTNYVTVTTGNGGATNGLVTQAQTTPAVGSIRIICKATSTNNDTDVDPLMVLAIGDQ